MNSNDRRDAKGGLRRLRRRQILTYAAMLAVVAAIPVAAGAASGPSPGKPTGLQNFSLRLQRRPGDSRDRDPVLLADAVLRVGAGPRSDALRVRALDGQELRL